MTFSESAIRLCGQCALLLGWRPDDFWNATPAELTCILSAMMPQHAEPPTLADIIKLKEKFPDGSGN